MCGLLETLVTFIIFTCGFVTSILSIGYGCKYYGNTCLHQDQSLDNNIYPIWLICTGMIGMLSFFALLGVFYYRINYYNIRWRIALRIYTIIMTIWLICGNIVFFYNILDYCDKIFVTFGLYIFAVSIVYNEGLIILSIYGLYNTSQEYIQL